MDDFLDVLLVVMVRAILFFVQAWGFMLCMGAAHSYYEGIPALGYVASLWVVVAVLWIVPFSYNKD